MLNTTASATNKLKKVLGVAFGIAVIVGSTIGVGILRTPGVIASLIPHPWLVLLCWLIIGIYILLSSASYAELTAMLPKAGGPYNYIKRAFGNYAGFVTGWLDFISNGITPSYFCIVLGEYCSLLFPGLAGFKIYVATGFLTLFTLINLPGTKSSSIIQQITSTLKIILFLVLVAGCFFHGQDAVVNIGSQVKLITGTLALAFFKALQLINGAYSGWASVASFAEEDNNPGKNIPKSYFIGAIIIMCMYLLINAAILYVVPVKSLGMSNLAAADAAGVAFGKMGSFLLTLVSVFSLVSILNAYLMMPPRILFGLGRDGFFIQQAMKINKGGTPWIALLCCFAMNFILILVSSFEVLFSLASFTILIVQFFALLSLFRLRKTEPGLSRPYKVWGYPYVTLLTVIITLALLIGFAFSDHKSLLIIGVLLVISYPLFLLLRKKEQRKVES